MPRYSPLRFRVFDGCRLRYRYQYIDRVRARLRPQDTAGSLVHKVLFDFFSKLSPDERNEAKLLEMFDVGWEALSPRYLQMPGVDEFRQSSLRQLKTFAGRFGLTARPFMVEPYFQVEVAPDITLFGRVDRIDVEPDGSLHIIDYKMGSHEDEIDVGQLRLYAIMAELSLGKPVSRLSFWNLDDGTAWTTEVCEEDKREAKAQLLAAVAEMEATAEFPARVGRHCGHCPYLHACSERREIARLRQLEGW